MMQSRLLVTVIVAIVVLIVVDSLLSRYWTMMPGNALVSAVVVFAVVAYVVLAITLRGRLQFRVPSFPRRRRMRVVQPRDPAQAASDFIKQFEKRAKH
ncbi:MAG: hypothetical protein JO103_11750 [Candidatus Eremiobacteraeota bacterium]|nr:hypothetical protein [Candidatus Eremiobacteraeota bacterium]